MKAPATLFHGYEQYEGQLEVTPDGIAFARKKNRTGTFAAWGLLGLLFSSKYESFMSIPRADVTGVGLTADGQRLQVTTAKGPLFFAVPDANAWVSYMTRAA